MRSRLSASLLDLNRNRPTRTFELSPGHQFIQIHVVHIQQIGMLRFQSGQKFIQHLQGRVRENLSAKNGN